MTKRGVLAVGAGCAILLCSGCEESDRVGGSFGDGGSLSAGDTGSATTAPTSASGTDDNGSDPSGGSEGGVKFDTPEGESESAGDGGDCDCGNSEWSYVWIANSQQGTVSKINTRTLVEEGRYQTRPDGGGSPSRTSVSVDGKAVVVASRHGGITKIWAREEFCSDQNGQAGIQTSSGKTDVMAWGQDDCMAWHTPFANLTVQRPVQWTPGDGSCHQSQKIWTVGGNLGNSPGTCGQSGVWVYRLDGVSGAIEDTIHIPDNEFPCDHTGTDLGLGLGPYGGAVDYQGNFWFHGWGNGKLVRIDHDSLDYEIFGGGGYGITVDTEGRVWLSSSMSRFDYDAKQWQSQNVSGSGGIAQDLQGRMWAADSPSKGLVWVDMETLAVGDVVPLPAGPGWIVKGVSVDIDGYIWAVRQDETVAYKVDPDTYAIESYNGLNGPYTYSDMTGGAINNVTCNPPEG